MSDPQTTDTTAPGGATSEQPVTPPAEGRTAPAVKTFTQEEVNRIAANARAEGRAEKQAPAAKPAPESSTKTDVNVLAELQEMKQRLAFEKRTAKLELDDKKSDALFKVFQASSPEGFEEVLSMVATKSPQPITTPNGSTVDPAKTGAAAPTAPSGPVNPMQSGGLVDIFNLTAAQIDQLGPAGLREHYEKNLAVGQQRAGAPPRPRVLQRK
jgi:hypothetical protein